MCSRGRRRYSFFLNTEDTFLLEKDNLLFLLEEKSFLVPSEEDLLRPYGNDLFLLEEEYILLLEEGNLLPLDIGEGHLLLLTARYPFLFK